MTTQPPDVLERERSEEIQLPDPASAVAALQSVDDVALPVTPEGGQALPTMIDRATHSADEPLFLGAEQIKTLTARPSPEELDIKPDRTEAVYLSHTVCRARLNDTFGPFAWRIEPCGSLLIDRQNGMLFREYRLLIGTGRGTAGGARWMLGPRAWGEQTWLGSVNQNFTWGDALEGLMSNGLTRCCKQIGMTIDRRIAERFKKEHCVKVFVESAPRDGKPGKISVAWRRVDALPLMGELDILPDSPNVRSYQKPPAPFWRREKAGGEQQRSARQAAAQNGNGTHAAAASTERRPTISDKQVRDLWREVRKQQLSEDDVATVLRDRWHVTRSADIPVDVYPAILAWVKAGGD